MKRGNTPSKKKPATITQVTSNQRSQVQTAKTNVSKEQPQSKDEKFADEKLIAKIRKKGIESLTLEEMACTLISPTFESEYAIATGEDWNAMYKTKVRDRLNHAKFDIKWMNQQGNPKYVTQFSVFYDIVAKGDVQRTSEFMKKNFQYHEELLESTDRNKKSPLHISSKNGFTTLSTVLIDKGFTVHARDKFLRTPMHLASQFGHAALVDLLLKRKADIYCRDSCGR